MGLTKQYLRYIPAGNFNIIASQYCNVAFVTLEGQEGRFVAVGACEHIIIWDLRLGEKLMVFVFRRKFYQARRQSSHPFAQVQIEDILPLDIPMETFRYTISNLQRLSVSSLDIVLKVMALAYDSFGHKLVSGSKDTDVIVWDTVAEVGLCRLSGHRGAITQITFMAQQPVVISGSKDTFVKFWDLDTQHCFRTLVGHQTEVWSLTLVKDHQYLVTGCGDAELRVWKLSERSLDAFGLSLELTVLDDSDDPTHPLQCHKAGSLLRGGRGRVISMFSDASGQVVGCHGTDMQIELFQFLSERRCSR
ncbi:hypothetical protein NQ318_002570 [Aromia moschata]|uniref:WD repeat domain 31 n=1 Tax=Aromia moschata TaxID=1265417 RepID=A0AAV8Y7L7_9CUCU|nr:hypothetical protein NQ318_002570 [Aromia moschata]